MGGLNVERDDHLNPDCRDGKHKACAGDAWCMVTDEPSTCSCDCHATAVPA